ncbi:unnamed protein product [Blepharisma stoltei]|uniref:EF-hand domain-containing protein n=1 Tax=Blepharisma stoltei TaxID=1481888 RepID=A0AAU9I953_9CILI|nr:unnamed protein product [Blepharisma stoltei]
MKIAAKIRMYYGIKRSKIITKNNYIYWIDMGAYFSSRNPELKNLDLKKPVKFMATMLTKWNKEEISKLFRRFTSSQNIGEFYIDNGMIRIIFRSSNAQGMENEILRIFHVKGRVNAMEILAVLILYSTLNWKEKIKIMLNVFDFDGNKAISKDEMVILCQSFLRGFSCVTDNPLISIEACKILAEIVFDQVGKDANGLLTYDDLCGWISIYSEIHELFMINQVEEVKNIKTSRRKSILAGIGLYKTNQNRPKNESYFSEKYKNSTEKYSPAHKKSKSTGNRQRKFFIVGNKNTRYTKELIESLYAFYQSAEQNSKTPLKSLKAELIKHQKFSHLAHSLTLQYPHHENITFKELLISACPNAELFQINRMIKWVRNESSPLPAIKRAHQVSKRKLTFGTANTYRRVFEKIDTNHDGSLDVQELEDGFKDVASKEGIEKIFKEFDTDHNEKIDLKEFFRLMAPPSMEITDDILRVFDEQK